MSYLKDFTKAADSQNTPKLLELWEEFCSNDELDVKEFVSILEMIEKSPFASFFGPYVDLSLPLVLSTKDPEKRYQALAKVIDLQTTNTKELAEIALTAAKEKYGSDIKENTLRKVGLQPIGQFQKALSSIDLLLHLKPGNCVFHQAGFGTAEVMEVSTILERVSLECEYAAGVKHLSFDNALKTLIPLPKNHFLSKRFAQADQFEKEAKQDPVAAIKILLKDLGDKTAAEIRDEFCELVIPESDWTKWWQSARAKIKKDTSIEYPKTVKDPFRLREESLSHEDRFQKSLQKLDDPSQFILSSYQFVRDFPSMLKSKEIKQTLLQKLVLFFERKDTLAHQKLQILIFLEDLLNEKIENFPKSYDFLSLFENLPGLIEKIDILSFKKRAIALVCKIKQNWPEIYLQLLSSPSLPSPLKDYILQVLEKEQKQALTSYLQTLFLQPQSAPDTFLWYFQKTYSKEQNALPFGDKKGLVQGLEAFFLLLSQIEFDPEHKDLAKKMHQLLAKNRFEIVRVILEGTSIDFVREFLLISSKCHSLSDHDKKILRSLAQVVHPSLNSSKRIPDRERFDGSLLWTSEKGYLDSRKRLEQIATSEIVENAKEVEAARALGDLRENSEYKFAVEKRRQLQAELKRLGDSLNRARIITPLDVECEQVGIGNVVSIQAGEEEEMLTILGPWDTDIERNIISFQSKLAQSICGKKVGDLLQFKEKEYRIEKIESIFSIGQ